MESQTLISIREFCDSHGVEHTYIIRLHEFGLIRLEENKFIRAEQLHRLEKILRFNHDLEINLEGVEVIFDLLERVQERERKIVRLQNRLRLYE